MALEKIGCALYLGEASSEHMRSRHLALLLSACVLAGFMEIRVNLLMMQLATSFSAVCCSVAGLLGTIYLLGAPVGKYVYS